MGKNARLNNNINFYYKKNSNTPRTALCMNFSLNDKEKFPGIYCVMTRLFTQGTTHFTAEQLAEELDKYAIDFSAELKQDYIRFKFICLNEDFFKALEIMSDVIKNTTFENFEREVIKMQGEIMAELDSPRVLALENYYKTIFEEHQYGHTYTRILENIQNLSRDDVIAAYQNILHNSKKVITFAGDLDFEKVCSELNKSLGDLPVSVDEVSGLPHVKLHEAKSVEIIKPDLNQAHIVKGWLVPSYKSAEYPSLLLLNIILGASGLSSRLFLELRDKKGLAYVIRSSYETSALGANFAIYIATEPKNIEISLNGFKEEIDKIRSTFVTEEELANAKNNIIGKWAFTQETNNQQACLYAHHGVIGLGFDFNEKLKQTIKTVTPHQLLECSQKYFNDMSVLSIVKPRI